MVAHQHPGIHAPAGHLAGLAQRVEKEPPVVVMMKKVLAPASTRHAVVIRPGGLDANAACDAPFSVPAELVVKHVA